MDNDARRLMAWMGLYPPVHDLPSYEDWWQLLEAVPPDLVARLHEHMLTLHDWVVTRRGELQKPPLSDLDAEMAQAERIACITKLIEWQVRLDQLLALSRKVVPE
jgi:hypothetical protein